MLYDRETRNKLTGLWRRLNNAQEKYEKQEITEKEYIKKLDDIKILASELNIQSDGDRKDCNNLLHAMDDSLLVYGIKRKKILALEKLQDLQSVLWFKNKLLKQINDSTDKQKLKREFEEEYKDDLKSLKEYITSSLCNYDLVKAYYIRVYIYGRFIQILNDLINNRYEKIEDKHLRFINNLIDEL